MLMSDFLAHPSNSFLPSIPTGLPTKTPEIWPFDKDSLYDSRVDWATQNIKAQGWSGSGVGHDATALDFRPMRLRQSSNGSIYGKLQGVSVIYSRKLLPQYLFAGSGVSSANS